MTDRRLVGGFLGALMVLALAPTVARGANMCGLLGEPCCGGETCLESNLECLNNECVTCGLLGGPCCLDVLCSEINLVCLNDECVTCGGAGQPCCALLEDVIGVGQDRETTCNPGLLCRNGTCGATTAPALSPYSLAAAGMLLLGAGAYSVRRRRTH